MHLPFSARTSTVLIKVHPCLPGLPDRDISMKSCGAPQLPQNRQKDQHWANTYSVRVPVEEEYVRLVE